MGPFWGYLTSETIEMCIDFSRQYVTRTTAVSAIAYMILGTSQLLIIFLIGRLSWLFVKWQIVLLSFFLSMNKRNSLAKIFKMFSYSKASQCRVKVSCSYQSGLCFQIQVHGIEENIERQQGVISLAKWLLEFLRIKVWIFTVNLDWEFLGIPRNS